MAEIKGNGSRWRTRRLLGNSCS